MRIRAVVVTLAVAAVAALLALPAFATKRGTAHPYKNVGTQSGTFSYKKGPPEVFAYDIVGPNIGSLGKSTVRSYTDASGKNERSTYTFENGDKLYAIGLQDQLPTKGIACPGPAHGATLAPWYGWEASSETNIVKGGTGQFKNATGRFVTRGCFTFVSAKTWIVTYTEKGTITY